MKKNKRTKTDKTTTLLGGATKSLRKLGKDAANGIGGLSTAQKVAGGAALVALGLSILTKKRRGATATEEAVTTPDYATAAEANLASLESREDID